MQSELYSVDQKIKGVNREKDIMASDSEDRVKLSLKKTELVNQKKKYKKMLINFLFISFTFGLLFSAW